MNDTDHSDDWRSLCEMASTEYDPLKLLDLVVRINQALEKCRGRNEGQDTPSQTDVALPMADFFSFPARLSPAVEYDS